MSGYTLPTITPITLPFDSSKVPIYSLGKAIDAPVPEGEKSQTVKENVWSLDDRASKLSFEIRRRWGKNIQHPLKAKHIATIDYAGHLDYERAILIIDKSNEDAYRDWLEKYLKDEDEYMLGSFNSDIYENIGLKISDSMDEIELGLFIRNHYFESFFNYLYDNFAPVDIIRHEYMFSYENYEVYLYDVNDWESIKEDC